MSYLELLQAEHKARQFRLATPKPLKPQIRYYDPDILKINSVLKAVAKYYDYPVRRLRERDYNCHVVQARYMVFYICRHLYGLPIVKIQKSVGKRRDRTAINKGVKVIHARLQTEPALAADLRDIRGML